MNFRLSGQKIDYVSDTKYLGVLLDEHLTFQPHLQSLKEKLNRANNILAKLRYSSSPNLIRTVYYAIFESHLRYGCQIWGQKQTQSIKEY